MSWYLVKKNGKITMNRMRDNWLALYSHVWSEYKIGAPSQYKYRISNYKDVHYKDKNSYTGKMLFLYQDDPGALF